jgi:LCP family protein required for cell wall assembly
MGNKTSRSIYLILALVLFFILVIFAGFQTGWPRVSHSDYTTSPSTTPTLTVWPKHTRTYPGPVETPVTPIPDPLQGVSIHDEMESIVLLGLDEDFPYTGRSEAMHLILYNRRTAMASVISIPPDLVVYIPGYTMQRINTAYSMGGITMVKDTLEYNLGIYPDHYMVVQYSDFSRLVDGVAGIDVVVIDDLTDPCELPPGKTHMNGVQAFCYSIYRRGEDDIDRNRRQLQVMRAFFLRMIVDAQIARLPVIHAEFQDRIQTDLTLTDILTDVPLAIMLADPKRVGYFQISWDEVTQWIMPGRAKTLVFLPKRDSLLVLIQAAVDFLRIPAPQSDLALTLQMQLTNVILSSFTPTPSLATSSVTPGVTITATLGTTTPTETPTPTGLPYPYPYP